MQTGIAVNPFAIREGDSIALRPATHIDPETGEDAYSFSKTKQVKRVTPCEGKPENIHLDHECYDGRFSKVIIPASK